MKKLSLPLKWWDQGESLPNLAREYFESATITVHKDMSGKDRMLTIEL